MWRRWVSGLAPAAGMFAGITAGAVVFLLVIALGHFRNRLRDFRARRIRSLWITRRLSTKPTAHPFVNCSSRWAAAPASGGGLVLSSEFPGDPLRTAQQRILVPLNLILYWIATPVRERQVARAEARIDALKARNPVLFAKRMAEVQRTCIPGDPVPVLGKETILNYATIEIQQVWMEEGKPVRFTHWSAPDLHCVALKSTTEKTLDGRFRLAFERARKSVTMNIARP